VTGDLQAAGQRDIAIAARRAGMQADIANTGGACGIGRHLGG